LPPSTFLLFNVDTNEFNESGMDTLSQIANRASSCIRKIDDEILLMSKEQIIDLLKIGSHYNFNLIEVEGSIDEEKVIRILDLSEKSREGTVVDKTDSEIYMNSHDDCYLYIETKDKTFAEQLISRQFETLVTTIVPIQVEQLNFDPREIMLRVPLSVVIPQIHHKEDRKIIWKILEGTFKDFVYEKELPDSGLRLVLTGSNLEIERSVASELPDQSNG